MHGTNTCGKVTKSLYEVMGEETLKFPEGKHILLSICFDDIMPVYHKAIYLKIIW